METLCLVSKGAAGTIWNMENPGAKASFVLTTDTQWSSHTAVYPGTGVVMHMVCFHGLNSVSPSSYPASLPLGYPSLTHKHRPVLFAQP